MRVIAGLAKGHNLASPKGMNTRPTADRIKQSLFNIISADLHSAAFLDLFAGSGAMGIEALSQGAAYAGFVDSSKEASEIILKNLRHTKLLDKSSVHCTTAENALNIFSRCGQTYNIIFMDPPYAQSDTVKMLTAQIKELGLLREDGYIIGEHSANADLSSLEGIALLRRKDYGKTTSISFWRPV